MESPNREHQEQQDYHVDKDEELRVANVVIKDLQGKITSQCDERRKLELQIRDLRNVVDLAADDLTVALNLGCDSLRVASSIRMLREVLSTSEKRKGVCTHNALNPTLGKTLCLMELPCPDHD